MEIFQVVGLGLTAVVLLLVLKEQGSSMGMLVTLAFGVLIFLLILDKIGAVLTVFQELANRAGVNLIYVSTIFKVMGIAYLAEFSAQICRDAGSQAIAGKIELASKVIIMTLAIPILLAILEAIVALLPQGG